MVRRRSNCAAAKATPRRSATNLPQTVPPKAPKPAPVPYAAAKETTTKIDHSTGEVFKDMAATAAGVAAGSAIGHAVGHGITSAFSGGRQGGAVHQQAQASPSRYELAEEAGLCNFEIKQFLKCTQANSDLRACEAFNEALRQCKIRYDLQ